VSPRQQRDLVECVVDIETVGPSWESIDEETRIYLEKRAEHRTHNPDTAEADARDHLALDLGLAEIVAIGLHPQGRGQPHVLLRAPVQVDSKRGVVQCYKSEKDLLSRFWHVVKNVGRVITYNGRGFDGAHLMVRSAQQGVPCARDLIGYRYDIADNCDLMDCLSFFGSIRDSYSLDWWCRRFGIASPKAKGITGADVGRLHREERYAEIVDYLFDDLEATSALFQHLIPLLSHFKGGPLRPIQELL